MSKLGLSLGAADQHNMSLETVEINSKLAQSANSAPISIIVLILQVTKTLLYTEYDPKLNYQKFCKFISPYLWNYL